MSTDTRQQRPDTVTHPTLKSETQQLVTAQPRHRLRRRRPLHSAVMIIIAASLVAVVGMLYLLQINYVASLGYDMSALQRTREARSVENQRLRAQIAELQSLDRIEEVAVDDLGMEPYEDYRFLSVTWPESSELQPPEPLQPAPDSLLDRLRNALFGEAAAVDDVESGSQ